MGTPPKPAFSASALRRFNIFADRVKKPWPPPLLLLPVSELPVEDTTYGLPPRSAEQNWLGWWLILIPALLVAGSSGWQVGSGTSPATSPSHSRRTEQGDGDGHRLGLCLDTLVVQTRLAHGDRT